MDGKDISDLAPCFLQLSIFLSSPGYRGHHRSLRALLSLRELDPMGKQEVDMHFC